MIKTAPLKSVAQDARMRLDDFETAVGAVGMIRYLKMARAWKEARGEMRSRQWQRYPSVSGPYERALESILGTSGSSFDSARLVEEFSNSFHISADSVQECACGLDGGRRENLARLLDRFTADFRKELPRILASLLEDPEEKTAFLQRERAAIRLPFGHGEMTSSVPVVQKGFVRWIHGSLMDRAVYGDIVKDGFKAWRVMGDHFVRHATGTGRDYDSYLSGDVERYRALLIVDIPRKVDVLVQIAEDWVGPETLTHHDFISARTPVPPGYDAAYHKQEHTIDARLITGLYVRQTGTFMPRKYIEQYYGIQPFVVPDIGTGVRQTTLLQPHGNE